MSNDRRTWRREWLVYAMLWMGILSFLPAHAQDKETLPVLKAGDIVGQAVRDNPVLKKMRAKWEAAEELPAQEASLPDPMLSYSRMNPANGSGINDTFEQRFEIEQTFPWIGKRGLRRDMSRADAVSMGRDYETAVLDVIMRTQEAYYELYGIQESLRISRSEEDVLGQMEKVGEAKYAAATIDQQDVLKIQAEITLLKAKRLELAAQETAVKARLNAILNRRADEALGMAQAAPDMTLDSTKEQLLEYAAKHRPELQGADAQIERYKIERRLAAKEYYPDYKIGAEYRQPQEGGDMVMVTVGIEVPLWRDKYKTRARGAERMEESALANREAIGRQVATELLDAFSMLQAARQTVELYRKSLIPQAEASFKAGEAAYRTGKGGFLDLLESKRFLLNARLMCAMAESNAGIQFARLERAVGADLKSPMKDEVKNAK